MLYERRDYFALRDKLEGLIDDDSAQMRFFSAAVQYALNEPSQSNRTIHSMLDGKTVLPVEQLLELRHIQLNNYLRLHQYPRALEVARKILSMPIADDDFREDVANTAKLLESLTDVPPMKTTVWSDTVIRMKSGEVGGWRVPIEIDGQGRHFITDTGANLSVLMRSEAEALGLEIRPVGLEVDTSIGGKVLADLAVADSVILGNARFHHVVFLVFPDELLSFPEHGVRIPGIIGFPLLAAVVEVHIRNDGVLEIPAQPRSRGTRNLALEELTLLVRVRYENDWLVCRFDTGANKTVFYEPFFQRHRDAIEERGERHTAQAAGVGGSRRIRAYRLPEIELTIGSSTSMLGGIDVYSEALGEDRENYLMCNLGLDVVEQNGGYSINFETMSLEFDEVWRGR